jgi:hypothetical protein
MVITLYTDINGIELNQEREPFIGTYHNRGQGYKIQVLKEFTIERSEYVEVSDKALLLHIEEC